ncbi:MAG: glycoside hydrolase [Parabacteroides sp.]|nr:glycoside hydrolase [Parabacteroides sp.]
MRKSYLYPILCAAGMVFSTACENVEPSIHEADPAPDSRVFAKGADGYAYYRIPAMVITDSGTVLAFAEGRKNGPDDEGDIDLVMKRSADRGATWSELTVVKDDGENRSRNPVPVWVPGAGRVVLVSCWNPGATGTVSVFVTYSDDEGLTWAPQQDITQQVTPPGYRWYATGPCHGIVKQFEPHKGRIVVPCNHNTVSQGKGRSHVIYSDDNGLTWALGGIVDMYDTNESTVTELSNGDLMLNMRCADTGLATTDRFRIVSSSSDGGVTWSPCMYSALKDPMCQGSILYYGTGADGRGQLLFSNPDHQSSRKNNTLRMSADDGKTWPLAFSYTGAEGYDGYSDIARYADGTVGVLYEFGFKNLGGICFRNVALSELQ